MAAKMGPVQRQLLYWLQNHTGRHTRGWTITHLAHPTMTDLDYRQVESALAKLRNRGLVEEAGTHRARKIWRLTDAGKEWSA